MCRARSVAVSTFSIPTSLAAYLYLYDDQIRLHCDDNQIIGCTCADYHSGGRDSGIDIRVKPEKESSFNSFLLENSKVASEKACKIESDRTTFSSLDFEG